MDLFKQVWTSLNKFEQVWTSLNKFEQIWTSLDKLEQVNWQKHVNCWKLGSGPKKTQKLVLDPQSKISRIKKIFMAWNIVCKQGLLLSQVAPQVLFLLHCPLKQSPKLGPFFRHSHLQQILAIPARYSWPVASVISGLYCI